MSDSYETLKVIIENSGWFDKEYYLRENPGVAAAGIDPIWHYINFGSKLGLKPSENNSIDKSGLMDFLLDFKESEIGVSTQAVNLDGIIIKESGEFDPDFYLRSYPDISATLVDPLEHFINTGVYEGRNPNQEFSVIDYCDKNNIDFRKVNGFVHYLKRLNEISAKNETVENSLKIGGDLHHTPFNSAGVFGGTSVPENSLNETSYQAIKNSGLFDAEWYREFYADVLDGMEAYEHFIKIGDSQLLSPSKLFDSKWYLARLNGDLGGFNGPFDHYLNVGRALNLPTIPQCRLGNLLLNNKIFDEVWYINKYLGVKKSGFLPLTHFVEIGVFEDNDPSPYFNTAYYKHENEDVASSGWLLLEHYLVVGAYENRKPNKVFIPREYINNYNDISLAGVEPLSHYVNSGVMEGRKAGSLFDENFYVYDNPDVDFITYTPMAHYLDKGEVEGRFPVAPSDKTFCQQGQLVTFSFVIDAFGCSEAAIEKTILSLKSQNLENWNAVICINSSKYLSQKILSRHEDNNLTILESSDLNRANRLSAAFKYVNNLYFIILDAGDQLANNAIEELNKVLRYNKLDVLYSDESQKESELGNYPISLKPAWSPELLLSYNYWGRLTAIKTSVASELEIFSSETSIAAEWDLALKLSEITNKIERLPKILCDRSAMSNLDRPNPKSFNAISYHNVLRNFYKREGKTAEVFSSEDGTFYAEWKIKNPPLVSVIIPSRNKPELVRMVIKSLTKDTSYSNLEIIIVDNLSDNLETLEIYEDLEAKNIARIVKYNKNFNYSAACNAGAKVANGEYLLFLNNDIEAMNDYWLDEMVKFAMRPGVGIVGTMLRYPSGELQHAGVVVGMHLCGLVFRAAELDTWGPFGSPSVTRNWMAIMGACQMVSRKAFDKIGGFDERYHVANSDVALCVRAWLAGYRTVYAPRAWLTHHEGATRGRSNPTEDILRTALDFKYLGITEDPYYHPALSSSVPIPTIVNHPDLDIIENLRNDLNRLSKSARKCDHIDIFNLGEVSETVGLAANNIMWQPQLSDDIYDVFSASRFVITLLILRDDLRELYPKALSEGSSGGFYNWLIANSNSIGLEEKGRLFIKEAFDAGLSNKPLQAYLLRDDVKADNPLALTPGGIKGLINWLFLEAKPAYKLKNEEIWWLLLECNENPDNGIILAWLFNTSFQRFYPAGITEIGRKEFAEWLKITYGTYGEWSNSKNWPSVYSLSEQVKLLYNSTDFWKQNHKAPFKDSSSIRNFVEWLKDDALHEPHVTEWFKNVNYQELENGLLQNGVNLISHFSYPSGLRISAEMIDEGIRQNGWGVNKRDVMVSIESDDPVHHKFIAPETFDISIIHIQPEPFFGEEYERAHVMERKNRTYRIAYWYWELEDIPSNWIKKAINVDEIWTATKFVGDALRAKFNLPIYNIMPGIKIEEYKKYPKEYFGINDDFTFLFTFHMTSIMERKNPLAVIEAFKMAFKPSDKASLIIKTSFGFKHIKLLNELKQAAKGSKIKIIDEIYSRDEVLSLTENCDCYVSLHKSEGLGLTMAEAMLLGKPVIATRYSGNIDFMSNETSLLVDYDFEVILEDAPPYMAGSKWALPKVSHAAELMRKIYDEPDLAKKLGNAGREHMLKNFSVEASGRKMITRLDEIRHELVSKQNDKLR